MIKILEWIMMFSQFAIVISAGLVGFLMIIYFIFFASFSPFNPDSNIRYFWRMIKDDSNHRLHK